MGDLTLYLTFTAAVLILAAIPGPNVAIITANSISHGARYGAVTVAGTSSAMVLQLAITVMGMAAPIRRSWLSSFPGLGFALQAQASW